MKHARPDYDRFQDPLGKIPENEPVFLIRGQDAAAVPVLRYYLMTAIKVGAKLDLIEAVYSHIKLMEEWQRRFARKTPDLPTAREAPKPFGSELVLDPEGFMGIKPKPTPVDELKVDWDAVGLGPRVHPTEPVHADPAIAVGHVDQGLAHGGKIEARESNTPDPMERIRARAAYHGDTVDEIKAEDAERAKTKEHSVKVHNFKVTVSNDGSVFTELLDMRPCADDETFEEALKRAREEATSKRTLGGVLRDALDRVLKKPAVLDEGISLRGGASIVESCGDVFRDLGIELTEEEKANLNRLENLLGNSIVQDMMRRFDEARDCGCESCKKQAEEIRLVLDRLGFELVK